MNYLKKIIILSITFSLMNPNGLYAFDLSNELIKLNLQHAIEKYRKNYPAFSVDGVTIPESFLLEQLKKQIDSQDLIINKVSILPQQGVIDLTSKRIVDLNLKIKFNIQQIDWKKGFLIMSLDEEKHVVSSNIFGRIVGTIALSLIEVATGKSVLKQAVSNSGLATALNDNAIKIHLDKISPLDKLYSTELLGKKMSDYVGVKDIQLEDQQIRVKMGKID